MAYYGIGLVLAVVASTATAACEYKVTNMKLSTCDGKPNDAIELKDINVDFNNDCNIRIFGCGKFLKEIKKLGVDYNAKKNGMQVLKDKKNGCNQDLFGAKINCPVASGTEICATDSWIVEVPKGMLPMAVGEIKGEGKLTTDSGTYCYKASAVIKKA